MNYSNHVTYIKLPAYLAIYFRGVMLIPDNKPLILPKFEMREYFMPFLKENTELYRNPAKNDRGYYKDTTSYTEEAYNIATAQTSDITIDYSLKIPTLKECAELTPFSLPKTIHLPKSKDKPARDVKAHAFFELKEAGASEIRSYIRDMFYAELHDYVITKQRIYTRMNKICDVTLAVESWLTKQGILPDDDFLDRNQKESVRTSLYKYDAEHYPDGDPDSIRRMHTAEMNKGHLTSLRSSRRKKRTKLS